MNDLNGIDIEGLTSKGVELLSTWGVKVVGGLVVLLIGWLIARSLRNLAARGFEKASIDPTLSMFLGKLVYYLVLAMVVIATLNLFGIQTASLIAVLGAAGLAVGLALQGTLTNFSSGVMLLLFRPFRVGDFIDAGGVAGTVQEIGLFATILHTPDNVRIIVPNSAIQAGVIRNFAANDNRRVDMTVGVSYSDDLGVAKETLEKIIQADERVLEDPAPVIAVNELGDSSVNFIVRPWCKKEDYWNLKWDMQRAMKEALEAAGCSIPFPQMDVHIEQESA